LVFICSKFTLIRRGRTKKMTKTKTMRPLTKAFFLIIALMLAAGLALVFATPGGSTVGSCGDTGWKSPALSDGSGFTYPDRAFTCSDTTNKYATVSVSGTSQKYGNFSFSTIPADATITGIAVDVTAHSNSDSYRDRYFEVALSWNSGSSWAPTTHDTSNFGTSDTTANLAGSGDTWGRTWSANDFTNANFRVRLTAYLGSSRNLSLDCVQVIVYYCPPPVPNPPLPTNACGLDIVLVMDESTSIDNTELGQMQAAFNGFVDALLPATPTEFALVDFGTLAYPRGDFNGDGATVKSLINQAELPDTQYTNWQQGLLKAEDYLLGPNNRPGHPDLVIFASDGNPNRTGDPSVSVSESEAVAAAVTVADAIKALGTRIITIGIGNELNTDNLIAISSDDAQYTGDLTTLSTILTEIATKTCGGTITVKKVIDMDGDLNTTGDQITSGSEVENWVFTPSVTGGSSSPTEGTTDNGGAVNFDISISGDTATASVVETGKTCYNLIGGNCTGATTNGTFDGVDSIDGIVISPLDFVSCTFYNTPSNLSVTMGGDDSVCEGNSTTITANVTGGATPYSYDWSASTAPGTGNDGTYTATGSGKVEVTVTDDIGCTATASTEVIVYAKPVATASSNSPVYVASTIALYGRPAGMSSYSWTGPDGFTSSLQNPTRENATLAMAGTYTLTVVNANGCSACSSTYVVVTEPPPPPPQLYVVILASVVVTPGNATVGVSGTQQFKATANYSNGSNSDITSSATWSSGDTLVATVSAGLATGVELGNTSITATYGGNSGSATLNVISEQGAVVSIIVIPESASIAVGQNQQFMANATYENGSSADITSEAIWESGNITVATISAGNATGVGVGTTDITATLGSVTSEPAILTVGPAIPTSIIVTPEGGSVETGGTQQLTATAEYSDGSTVDVTNQVTWSSSNEGIASIDEGGLATGKSAGDIEVTASLSGVSGSATLTVNSPKLLSILITPESASIPVNGTQQFVATGVYSDNSSVDVTASATWTSSDSGVATIVGGSATGKDVGSTDIVASLGDVTSNTASLSVTAAVPWSLIGGIIGGLLALGLLLFFLLRRRRREEPSETAA
jgi:hypothetical protein